MTTVELLSHLRSHDVQLWIDNDRLRYSAPNGLLTPALRAELTAHKVEIITFLRQAETATRSVAPPILPRTREGGVPLSFAQQRLWFMDQLMPGDPFYNIPLAVRLTGPCSVLALEESLSEILRRHEVLRTTFTTADVQPVQVITPAQPLALPVVDLLEWPETEREAQARRLAAEEALRPFDLGRGPLWRAALLQLGTQEHVLLLTMHHIVSDGWSMRVLFRELLTLYEAFSRGRPSPLPALPIQYADFAVWQRDWLQGQVLHEHLTYWTQQLGDAPPTLALPTDRPRPRLLSSRGGKQGRTLPAPLATALTAWSREAGVTLFMTLLAAFQVLLARYTQQLDFCIGTPIANRTRAETEGLIGFFVNTLVLRTDLTGEPSFRALVQRVREVALGAYAHQDLPFEKLVEELNPVRDMRQTPLFQVMFVLQNTPLQHVDVALRELKLRPLQIDRDWANFDLTLLMVEEAHGLLASVEYNADLFEAQTIEHLLEHFQRLLEGIVADPEQRISTYPLLTTDERQHLLTAWNATDAPYPSTHCLQHLFEAQVERTPDAIAVVGAEQHLTYAAFNARANRLARRLQALGVGPEVLVGLSVERSVDMLVGLLGVLKAGGAYVPLDPHLPQERLDFLLQDAQVSVLLTQKHLLDSLPRHRAHVVCLDAEIEPLSDESEAPVMSTVDSQNLAYVIYTSGSTGKPKGVLVPHRAVVNHNVAVARHFRLQASDRVLQFATLSFDAAVEEILPTLMSGATLVLRHQEILPSGADLRHLIDQEQLTVLDLPTAYWHAWVAELCLDDAPLPATLRCVILGGDTASAERFTAWNERGGTAIALINTYGPTETTIVSTLYEPDLLEKRRAAVEAVPIGQPIANTRTYVVDAHLQPVPVGVPGELLIGGAGVTRGYLQRADLTAEKFIPDPFGPAPGARLYRTGDLVRYRHQGTLEFLGRVDQQVKIRGFRVELGEIEAALMRHPDLRDVAVVARETADSEKRLVAYAVPDRQPAPTLSALRHFLQAQLPDYMVPAAFVLLEALPRTPSGKVDRRALPMPEAARPALDTEFVAPQTSAEVLLVDVWKQVLRLPAVGVHDNFFALGGDSILGLQMIARARQVGLHFKPIQLFQHQTIAALASVASTAPLLQAEQDIVTGPVALTPIQHWFFAQHFSAPLHWNQSILLEVPQELEAPLLETAVGHLLRHHDALRLRFSSTPMGWQQVNTGSDAPVPFTCINLSMLPPDIQRAAMTAATTALQASLDLTQGPLLRVAYVHLGAHQAGRLFIVVHHLAVDGVSWRILLEDLHVAHQQLSRQEPVHLPPKTTAFQHWAQRLTAYAQSAPLRQEVAYWREVCQARGDRLPLDHADGVNAEASAETVVVALTPDETQALLHEVPAAYHTQINEVLLTALVKAFGRWTGKRTLLVDLEGHGREDLLDEVDLSRTVGWFTTVFPVLLDLGQTIGPGPALQAIKEQLRRIPNRGIGYGVLRYLCEDTELTAPLRALPQADISFNYFGQLDQAVPQSTPFAMAREPRGAERSALDRRSYILDVIGSVRGGRLHVGWLYSHNLHRRTTIEALAQGFVDELRALISHCTSPDAGGYTPADFTLTKLNQQTLGKVLARITKAKQRS